MTAATTRAHEPRKGAQDVLRSPRRLDLFVAVGSNPGIGFLELCRLAKVPPGTARHHLNVLLREGFIVERRHGAKLRLFRASSDDEPLWMELVLRREPALAALHDWLKANPRASQDQAIASMAARGWPRSTTQHRLTRLVKAGLTTWVLRGRYKVYTTAPLLAGRTALPLEAAHAAV